MRLFGAARYDRVLTLLEESGANARRTAAMLHEMLARFPERPELARDILLCEQEGDRIAHDIIHRLNGRGSRPPYDARDLHSLVSALDDIVDYAEQTADWLGIYSVEAPMQQAEELAEVLTRAAAAVESALSALHDGSDLSVHLVEIHQLENDGERLSRDAERVAVQERHRPDGRHPLDGHLRVARAGDRQLRDGRAPAGGDLAEETLTARAAARSVLRQRVLA